MEKKKHCKPLAISWYLLSIPAYIDASHSQVPSPLTDAVDARPNAAAVDRRVFGVTFGAIECPPGTAYCTGRGEIVTPLGRNRLFFFRNWCWHFSQTQPSGTGINCQSVGDWGQVDSGQAMLGCALATSRKEQAQSITSEECQW